MPLSSGFKIVTVSISHWVNETNDETKLVLKKVRGWESWLEWCRHDYTQRKEVNSKLNKKKESLKSKSKPNTLEIHVDDLLLSPPITINILLSFISFIN